MDDKQRRQLNAQRLGRINVNLRPKVAAILTDMESHGLDPLIDGAVWRSAAEQAELKRKGFSKVSYSYHNCSTKAGGPDALAADIVSAAVGWNAPKSFWIMLGRCALAHGMDWGGFWGLPQSKRQALHTAIDKREFNSPVSLGWDVAHIEVHGISLLAARLGKRPD